MAPTPSSECSFTLDTRLRTFYLPGTVPSTVQVWGGVVMRINITPASAELKFLSRETTINRKTQCNGLNVCVPLKVLC